MNLNYESTTLAAFTAFLAISGAVASDLWTCNGPNLENLRITQNASGLSASISWDYAGGGATDGGNYVVRASPSGNGMTVYRDGPAAQYLNFALEVGNKSRSDGSFSATVFARNTEAPFPYSGNVVCLPSVGNQGSGAGYDAACGDPNSDEGIAAWDSGKCGPPGGGSN